MLKENLLDTPSMAVVQKIRMVYRYFQVFMLQYVPKEDNGD